MSPQTKFLFSWSLRFTRKGGIQKIIIEKESIWLGLTSAVKEQVQDKETGNDGCESDA